MNIKNFSFSKIQRNPLDIDKSVNVFLEGVSFRGASLLESLKNGKIVLSICFSKSESQSNIKCKSFRDNDPRLLEEAVNNFLVDKQFKFIVHSFISSRMTTVLFYTSEAKSLVSSPKVDDGNKASS